MGCRRRQQLETNAKGWDKLSTSTPTGLVSSRVESNKQPVSLLLKVSLGGLQWGQKGQGVLAGKTVSPSCVNALPLYSPTHPSGFLWERKPLPGVGEWQLVYQDLCMRSRPLPGRFTWKFHSNGYWCLSSSWGIHGVERTWTRLSLTLLDLPGCSWDCPPASGPPVWEAQHACVQPHPG